MLLSLTEFCQGFPGSKNRRARRVRSYDAGFSGSNINNLFSQTRTWQHGDAAANDEFDGDLRKALGAVRARTYLMPCTTDRYFTLEEVEQEAALLPADRTVLAPIVSDWGHRAGDPSRPGQEADAAFLRGKVAELLAAPPP